MLILVALLVPLACGDEGDAGEPGNGRIAVSGIWSRPVLTAELDVTPNEEDSATGTPDHSAHDAGTSGVNGVVYMRIENRSGENDRLTGAATDVAAAAELHDVQMENGVMQMRQVQGIDLPAGEAVALEPAGYHLMLAGLNQNLEVGDDVEVTLEFERAGSMTVISTVREDAP